MKRRDFIRTAGVGVAGAATMAAPAIAQSMPEIKWRMTTSWPKSLDTLYGAPEYMAKRIAERRLVKPDKINQAIGRLKERYPRVARYFDFSYHPDTATLAAPFNADKHAKAEQLDGCYLIKTDRTGLSGDELWRIYILLTRAEDAFRDMKSPLAERPIFHHTERRTEAHIFLCVLAYHLLTAIEKTLLDHGIHTSWRPCATPSRAIKSAPSSCPPMTVRPCASARPQLPSRRSRTSTAPSASPRKSPGRNTAGPPHSD